MHEHKYARSGYRFYLIDNLRDEGEKVVDRVLQIRPVLQGFLLDSQK